MKFAYLSIWVTLFVSCTNSSSDSLSAGDSLIIQFKTIGSESVSKTVSTTDKTAIKKLAQFVEKGKSEEHKCNNEGSLLFYRSGTVLKKIDFAYAKDGCKRFHWEDGGIMHDVKMSNEAADFLRGLAEGKSWY